MNENIIPFKTQKRLTDEQVIAIHRSHISVTKLAEEYGISRRAVYDIKNGTSHKHLKLGATKKFRELRLERLTGLPHREESVTGIQVLRSEGLLSAEYEARHAA